MARVMMRYACMENTYFYNQEPPPVEFYDFWQKFSVEAPNVPTDYVDLKKQSIAHIRKNTSSFNFYGRYTEPVTSQHDLDEVSATGKTSKKKILTTDAQRLSDIWKDVRISMSRESFISSSTKISENASMVQLENPWEEACSEDYQSSESDYGFDIQDHHRHHRHKQPNWQLLTDSQNQLEEKTSSLEFHTPQGLIDKQANAIAQSLMAIQKKDNRILVELATKPVTNMDIVDHFADDLDDSFLLDSFSYSDLPDEVFGPDFDFLNEDTIYKKKGKKGKKAEGATGKRGSAAGAGKGTTAEEDSMDADDDDEPDRKSVDDQDSSGSECLDEADEQCGAGKGGKGKKDKKGRGAGKAKKGASDESCVCPSETGGYKACLERRRKRIEDSLRNAVRSRSPMGSYRPKPGEQPLSKALQLNSPGPAAYNPSINAVKPAIHSAILAPRWNKNIYETPGPGPALYLPDPKCTCEMLTLHETPRFKDDATIGPGPAYNLANVYGTAKDKPKALLLSRKNNFKYNMGGEFTNCYGLTRFGRANPPNALIVSSRIPIKKHEPGPGEYDPKDRNDTRIGITMKSRLPFAGDNEKSPDFYNIAQGIGNAGGYTFGIKNFMDRKDQSPGPIYQINKSKPKPVSLTFRPFPVKGVEQEPSPIEWGIKPGIGKIKVLPRAPCPILHGNHDTLKGKFKTPGPNQYDICMECPQCTEPGASLKGRYPTKSERTPGPADYCPNPFWKRSPMPVFQHKWKEPKIKPEDMKMPESWRKSYGTPKKHRILGGIMTPRWRDREEDEESPGMQNIFGMTNHGNKTAIPISLKSRHTPFKYSHMADPKSLAYRSGKAGTCD